MLHILQRFKIIFVVFKVVRFGCYFLGLQVTNKKQLFPLISRIMYRKFKYM